MTQEVQPDVKPDSQDLINGIHIVEGENQLHQIVPWFMVVQTDTQNK